RPYSSVSFFVMRLPKGFFSHPASLFLIAFLFIAVESGHSQNPEASAPDSASNPGKSSKPDRAESAAFSIPDLIREFESDWNSVERYSDIPFSREDEERKQTLLERWTESLARLNFARLQKSHQIDYLLLRNHLKFEKAHLSWSAAREGRTLTYLPFGPVIADLEEKRRAFLPADGQTASRALTELAAKIADSRESVERAFNGKDPSGKEQRNLSAALAKLDELTSTMKRWNRFFSGYDPEFSWWTRAPMRSVTGELDLYRKTLADTIGIQKGTDQPIVGEPIGRKALLQALEREMIPYSPEELIDIGRQEYQWCLNELKKASREMGFGDKWKAAIEKVKTLHVKPGKQPQLIHELATEAVTFLEDRNLVTIPPLCKETWRMEMMPPDRQKVNPYFTGGETISVSFPTDEMSYEEKLMTLRGNNIHFCRAVVHHELIPGHHLQLFMADRYQTHRKLFRTPFLVEGWALYWEMLLWDLNFPKSAEDRIGMLFWRTHRCARILFSLQFHLGTMTPQEAIDYLVDNVGHERKNATAEVRRSVSSGYSPLYQAAYMLGGLQIRSLREELVTSGKMTDRAFHDAILHENSIPIELIRGRLIDQDFSPDYQPKWKFYPQTAGK
ncbi:MAG: DUF885 family protein, partial [Verrucomicrobiota bacterium]